MDSANACRSFVLNVTMDFIVVQLNFSNAFNCLYWDSTLEFIKQSIAENHFFSLLSYSNGSVLKFRSRQIPFLKSIQQSSSLGPLIFYLTIHSILRELSSPFTISFKDNIVTRSSEL